MLLLCCGVLVCAALCSYAEERILGWKDVHGGHHDAGDYGTYTYPLTYTLHNLLTGYDPNRSPQASWSGPVRPSTPCASSTSTSTPPRTGGRR